jgi:hypothetical protein
VEVVHEAQNKPVYWDSSEAVKLFGFDYDEGYNLYNGLVDRCELLGGAEETKRIQINHSAQQRATAR